AAVAAIAALAFLFFWPMLFGAQPPHPVAAPLVQQPEPQAKVVLPTATVLRNVNVRNAPSTSAAILTTLKRGATVAVAERSGSWTRIEPATEGQGAAHPGWIITSTLQPAGQKTPVARSPTAPEPAPDVAAVPEISPPPAPEAGQAAQTPPESAAGPATDQ
ncbi:MAG TPA: SH3 domain-containing protein, partial [Rhizomicrobium sp.]|nr:SH3 domain-containing protein [Rhizomicrobium sp.]